MKITFTVAVLYSLLLTAAMPAAAQERSNPSQDIKKRSTVIGSDKSVTASGRAKIASAEAFSEGRGALVRWITEGDTDTVGYFIHRIEARTQSRVNTSIVPRSSASDSEEYRVFDPNGDLDSVYLVEALTTSGGRRLSNKFTTTHTPDLAALTGFTSEQHMTAALSENKNLSSEKLELTGELLEIVESSMAPPDQMTHQWVVSQPGARINVKRDGMYRVMRTQLPASVFDNTNPDNWRLFTNGNEQAINVGPGGQYIEFYGRSVDTAETDQNAYYLVADTQAGRRMESRFIRPFAGGVPAKNYRFVTEFRERTVFLEKLKNGPRENYFGDLIYRPDEPDPIVFNLTGVDPDASTATVTIKIQGWTKSSHHVNPTLNGHALAPIKWDGDLAAVSQDIVVPASHLKEGANSLVLTANTGDDFSYFDAVKIAYDRRYVAAQNRVAFTTPGSRKATVVGFSSPNIRAFDTSVDGNPVLIANAAVSQSGNTFSLSIPAGRPAVLHAVEDSGLLPAESVSLNTPSTLSSPTNSADAIIISHSSPDMLAAAESWANYRRSATGGGFNVKVVDVRDIFDEFSYGVAGADAVSSFLAHAYTSWQVKPKYVLLLGDSTIDPRNYEGFGLFNLVPTEIVEFWEGASASDDALADLDGDGLAEMAIGRVAVRSGADANVVLNKTILFETPALLNLASRGVTFAYDQPVGWDFGVSSQLIAGEMSPSVPREFIQRMLDGSTQSTLKASVDSGKFAVNWAGHGSTGVWGHTSPTLLQMTEVPTLTNSQRPTIFTMLTCLNGYFIRPNFDSMSEALTKSSAGGAVAAWASTTKTTPDLQEMMGRRFYDKLDSSSINRLGDLILDAKTVVPGGDDVRFSWALIGDPMLKIR